MQLSVSSPAVQIGALVTAFAGGILVGRLLTKKKYSALAELEIKEAKEFYATKAEVAERDLKSGLAKQMKDISVGTVDVLTSDLGYREGDVTRSELIEQVEQMEKYLDENGDEIPSVWDWKFQLAHRDEGIPYIIHIDEFENGSEGYSQTSLVYYEEDDVLVDEAPEPLDKYNLIGMDTLNFGYGSGDPHIVYVRNDRMQIDMEITLFNGSYAKEVLGLMPETELKHSHRGRRKSEYH